MRKFKVCTLILSLFVICCMCACGSSNDFSDKIKVVFELEGGKFQNSEMPVTYYYNYDENNQIKIYDPETVTKKKIERPGYDLIGWQTKKEVNGEIVYEQWDFENNLVGLDGLTLYAIWKRQLTFTYNLCYIDNGEKISLNKYEVNEGDKFSDYLNFANKRYGYTPLGFIDENGNPWNDDFVHPGGEVDLEIDVFVNYLEGIYELVYDATDFTLAKNRNIYLMNDIDMGGKSLSFDGYNKVFMGNDHKISNFVVKTGNKLVKELDNEYSTENSLVVSLFGELNGGVIKDVTFDNVTFEITTKNSKVKKIYVVPLCGKATDATIDKVIINGKYEIGEFRSDFDINNIKFITDNSYYVKDDNTVDNSTINIEIINEN